MYEADDSGSNYCSKIRPIVWDVLVEGREENECNHNREDKCQLPCLCHWVFHHVHLTLLIAIRITTTKAKKGITPQEFYKKYVDLPLEDYVSVINAPTADKPYGRSYTVEMLGNVVGSRAVRYINVPMERLKELAIAQMQ